MYSINGAMYCTVTTSPYSCTYKTPSTSQEVAVEAWVSDATGASGQVSTVINVASAIPSSTFTITTPAANATVSGTTVFTGQAGSQWVNVAAFDVNNNYAKISADVTPSNGSYSVSVNTASLANGATTIGIIAFSVPAGKSGGTSSEVDVNVNVQNNPTLFNVKTPIAGTTVSGTTVFRGQAGSQWVNVAAFDVSNNYAKISADVTPSNGSYSVSVNTASLANGTTTIGIIAFSVPAGKSGGTSSEADVSVNVQNNPTLFNVKTPAAGATVSGTTMFRGQAGSQWVNVAAFDVSNNYAKISADVTPSNGTYSISVNTASLANGATTIGLIAFSVPAGQSGGTSKEVDVAVNVQNTVTPSPTPTVTPSPTPTGGQACSGTNYYVSAAGSDSNIGTSMSSPWHTVAKVNAGPSGGFKAGNCINFMGGETFNDSNLSLSSANVSNASPSNPIIVQSYGTGNATIASAQGGDISAAIEVNSVNGFIVQNLIVRPGAGFCRRLPWREWNELYHCRHLRDRRFSGHCHGERRRRFLRQ